MIVVPGFGRQEGGPGMTIAVRQSHLGRHEHVGLLERHAQNCPDETPDKD
jgi:hypothetical protein